MVPATFEHARLIAPHMRAVSRQSFCLPIRMKPLTALRRALRQSHLCYSAIEDGQVVAMGGCAGTLLGDEGYPWMTTADRVEGLRVSFVREVRAHLGQMLGIHSRLIDFVSPDDRVTQRFLGMLGFDIGDEPLLIGRHPAPMLRCVLER